MRDDNHPHTHLLHSYALTRLEPEERRFIDRHLRWCRRCRDEVEALSSILKSRYPRESPEPLPVPEPPPWAARKTSGESGPAARSRGLRPQWVLASAATLILMAALSAVALLGPGDWYPRAPNPDAVVFEAPRRGAAATPVLAGTGPWRVRVLLPFDAPAGAYAMHVRTADGAPHGPPLAGQATHDGRIETTLAGLRPGRYQLVLLPGVAGDEDGYVYVFHVVDLPWDASGN